MRISAWGFALWYNYPVMWSRRFSLVGLTLLLAFLAACSSPVNPSNPEGGASGQGKPLRPSNFRVTKVTNGFQLQWDAVAGATGYKLQRTGAGGSVSPAQPSYLEQDPSIKAGDKVEYSVWAQNGSILSDALTVTVTMPSSGTVTPPQPPSLAQPTNLRVSAVSGGFLIQWDAVSGATGYKFQRTGGGVVSTSQPSFTETNAKAGDRIEYSVWATNGSTTSAALVATLTMPSGSSTPTPTPPSSGLVTTTYQPSDGVFPNPERGFHDNVPFPFPPDWNLSDPNLFKWIHDRDSSITILRGMVRLDAYRNGSIDSTFLSRMNDSFARIRQEGFKVMLRFMYNYDSGGNDAPLNTVLNHISQLKPVLQNNADVIVSMQAGFIGAWGEWHNSQNGLDSFSNKQTILNAILGALPSSRMVQIRYPLDTMQLYPSALTAGQAFSGSNQSRVGGHIDCFLNPDQDGGTWDGMGQFSSLQMQSYMQQTSQYTVMSGETCEGFWNSDRGACPTAMSELQKYHFDMFNNVYYDPGSGNWPAGDNPRWVSGGCMDTIKRKLGYRLQLNQSQLSGQVRPGGEFYLSFTVSNVGWGNLFNPRKLEVILRHKASGKVYRLSTGIDPRTWLSGSTTTVAVSGGVPTSAPTGDYDVLLNLPDVAGALYGRSAYSVRLANQNVWESSTGFNSLLQTVNINTSASGNAYSGSNWFQ